MRVIGLTSEAIGGIARTRLHQHFSNDSATPLELTYTFGLPADGTVAKYEIPSRESGDHGSGRASRPGTGAV